MGVFLELGTLNLELLIDMFAHANSIYLLRRFDISANADSIYPRKGAGENTLIPDPYSLIPNP